jgi:hypothetical protein
MDIWYSFVFVIAIVYTSTCLTSAGETSNVIAYGLFDKECMYVWIRRMRILSDKMADVDVIVVLILWK